MTATGPAAVTASSAATTSTRDAPAKVNLALAVIGRRADGYHLLDTFAVFTRFGDEVIARTAAADSFEIAGPHAAGLAGDGGQNLVTRARDALRGLVIESGGRAPPVHLELVKNLPVASGIGGGSADAAATLRLLCDVWQARLTPSALERAALSLGADVPMCLRSAPLVARGIGEGIVPIAGIAAVPLVLVNPGVAVSTPDVFQRLDTRENPPLSPLPPRADAHALAAWVRANRNDLTAPAMKAAPVIGSCLDAISASGALASGMSGSGATCFAIFATAEAAVGAAAALRARQPSWFVVATETIASPD